MKISHPSHIRRGGLVAATLAAILAPMAWSQSAPPPPPGGGSGGAPQQSDRPARQDGQGQQDRGGRQNRPQQQDGQDQGGGRRGGMGRMFGGGGPGGPGGPGGGGMRDIREQLEPDFVRRDVPVFVRQLKLDDTQGTVLETLMKDYEDEFGKAQEEMQTALQDAGRQVMQNIITPDMRDRFQEQMRSIQDELRQLEEEKGTALDENTRRQYFRDRMMKLQTEMAEQRKSTGANEEMKRQVSEMIAKVTDWQTKKAAMRAHFIDGLKASLTDDQLSQWPAFERFLTREKTLPRGRLSGESTNLFFVLDEMKLPEDDFGKVEKLLDDYELRLDSALVARNEYLASSTVKIFKAIEQGDAHDAEQIFERQVALRAAVRDVNEEFRTAMMASLGESENAKKFEQAALLDGYDRIFRPTLTERAFEAALKLEGLDPTVVQSITELQTAYLTELVGKNRDLLALTRKEEPGQQSADAARFTKMMTAAMSGDFSSMAGGFFGGRGGPGGGGPGGPGAGGDQADPLRDGFDARNKLNDSYMERLKALLTPEQVEQLPRRQRGGQGGPGGQGGGMQRALDTMSETDRAAAIKKFDKNGNGEIDGDERAEFFREMRDSGAFGPGGGPGGQGGGRNRNNDA